MVTLSGFSSGISGSKQLNFCRQLWEIPLNLTYFAFFCITFERIEFTTGVPMFVLANFLNAIAYVLEFLTSIYMYIIIARAIISWVNPDPYNQIVQFLYRVTEPVMAPVRRWLPMRGMGIDLSPLVILLIIFFLQSFLVKSMIELAAYLR